MSKHTHNENNSALTLLSLWHYGFLALPLAFAGMPLYMHAPDFYATQQGMSLASLGVILLVIRGFDAVQDPLIGVLSDRYAKKRLFIQLVAIFALAIGFFGLFHPQPIVAPALWFAVSLLITSTAFSVLTINLSTLGAIWRKDQHQQTRIATAREAFGLIGLMLAAVTPTLLQRYYSAELSYHYFSLLMLAVLLFAALIFRGWYKKHSAMLEESESPLLSVSFLKRIKPFSAFYKIYGLSMLASSIPAVLFLFFVRDRIQAEEQGGLLLLLYFVAGVIAMPFWSYAARKSSPSIIWLASMSVAVAGFFWAYLLGAGDVENFAIVCMISGIALGAELALPSAIMAHLLSAQRKKSEATTHYAMMAFLAKAGLAISAGIVLPLLEWSGYRPAAPNTEAALMSLSFYYALVPCLIKIIAGVLLLCWIFEHKDEGEKLNEYTQKRSFSNDNHDDA